MTTPQLRAFLNLSRQKWFGAETGRPAGKSKLPSSNTSTASITRAADTQPWAGKAQWRSNEMPLNTSIRPEQNRDKSGSPMRLPQYEQKSVASSGNVLLAGPIGSGALLSLRSAAKLSLIRTAEAIQTPLPCTDALRFVHLLDGMAIAETERVSAGDGLQIPKGEGTTFDWASDGAALIYHAGLKAVSEQLFNRLHRHIG